MIMRCHHFTAPLWLGLCLLALCGCAAPPAGTASSAQAPALEAGMTRVWILRQANPPGGNIDASDPMVFANGAPIAQSKEGTAFFRDLPPGTYRFTVQPYGTPTGQGDTFQLVPGTQTYLQVQAVPNWQLGSPGGGSFTLLAMSPQMATQYLPTMTYLGPR
jgi:hypothetical protein